jgi:hypothetical protein
VKDIVLPAVAERRPMSPKVERILPVTTPLAMIVAKEKTCSTKPVMIEDKSKRPAKIEEGKKAIEDETPLGEGPFDEEFGGQKYRVHHTTRKIMCMKQLAEAIGYVEQLGYPLGSTIFGGGPNDYLYYCSDNLETEVCRHMTDNIGFPKLETMLSTMSSKDFLDRLAYTHLKVISIDCASKLRVRLLQHLVNFLTSHRAFS